MFLFIITGGWTLLSKYITNKTGPHPDITVTGTDSIFDVVESNYTRHPLTAAIVDFKTNIGFDELRFKCFSREGNVSIRVGLDTNGEDIMNYLLKNQYTFSMKPDFMYELLEDHMSNFGRFENTRIGLPTIPSEYRFYAKVLHNDLGFWNTGDPINARCYQSINEEGVWEIHAR